ncbi:hypothetical protein [Allorhizocola rhizosphaerae]|uniref:hypothetical protein n=1 Tax=Allorhizocola rhizosphaerae TaxID=1872709 RepID=UPI0013C2F03A|nr:hypothetical protein [Allorhizocola rhizosphaerae]
MTTVYSKLGTASPVLDLAFHCGEKPSLYEVSLTLNAVSWLGLYSANVAAVADRERFSYPKVEALFEALGSVEDESGLELLRVRRLTFGSPLETIVALASGDGVKVLTFLGGSLLILQRLMRMIIDWQRHRMDLQERRTALARQAGSSEELADVVRKHAASEIGDKSHPISKTAIPQWLQHSVEAVAKTPILKAEIRPDVDDVT